MTTTRFDQHPTKIYGTCATCGEDQATREDSRKHMTETREASGLGRSHRIRISNADRQHRINMHIARVVEEAIDDAARELRDLSDSGDVTEDEVHNALNRYTDFQESWDALS